MTVIVSMNTTTDFSSSPDAATYGIIISASASPNSTHAAGISVRGEYRVPYAEASVPKQATLMPRHIAMVVTRSDNYMPLKPFCDMVVFEDDVKDDGKCAAGNFSLNVFDHISFKEGGDYYILCSLGNYLSNIVKVTVS